MEAGLSFTYGGAGWGLDGLRSDSHGQSTGELHMLPSFQPIDPLGRAGDGKDPHGDF